jgi:DNA-binding MarR family transcriptional regulator
MQDALDTESTRLAQHIRESAALLHETDDPGRAEAALEGLAQNLTDAILGDDGSALDACAASLARVAGAWQGRNGSEAVDWAEQLGRVYGLMDVARSAAERRGAHASAVSVEPDTYAHRMLSLLADARESQQACNSGALAERLGVHKSEVSRTGRELIERGLVSTRVMGRKTFWEITPRGQYALEQLGRVPSEDRLPVAVALPELSVKLAKQLAASLTERHDGLTAYVLGRLPVAATQHKRAKPRPAPVMVMHGARVDPEALEGVGRAKAVQLEVEALSSDARAFTVVLRPAALDKYLPRRRARKVEAAERPRASAVPQART